MFTINNPSLFEGDNDLHPTRDDIASVWALPYRYITFQLETGEEGTVHIQGFVQLEDKQRITALSKLLPRAHLEKRKGTPMECVHYCQKPVPACECQHCTGLERFDTFFEDGILSHGDPISVLATAVSVLKDKGLTHTIGRFPATYVQYHAGMEKLAQFYSKPRDFQTNVTVLWGVPESGKSSYALLGPSPYFLAQSGGEGQTDFFGDYRPDFHQTLVVDEFYSSWKYTTFLRICDRYPLEVQTKGGFRQFLAREVIFTSNLPPGKWYPNVLADPNRFQSFKRRIHNIIKFTGPGIAFLEKVLGRRVRT